MKQSFSCSPPSQGPRWPARARPPGQPGQPRRYQEMQVCSHRSPLGWLMSHKNTPVSSHNPVWFATTPTAHRSPPLVGEAMRSDAPVRSH